MRSVRAVGPDEEEEAPARQGTASLKVARGAFVRTLRMTGLVESINFHNVAAPRLVGATGPGSNTLIITKLMPSGAGHDAAYIARVAPTDARVLGLRLFDVRVDPVSP